MAFSRLDSWLFLVILVLPFAIIITLEPLSLNTQISEKIGSIDPVQTSDPATDEAVYSNDIETSMSDEQNTGTENFQDELDHIVDQRLAEAEPIPKDFGYRKWDELDHIVDQRWVEWTLGPRMPIHPCDSLRKYEERLWPYGIEAHQCLKRWKYRREVRFEHILKRIEERKKQVVKTMVEEPENNGTEMKSSKELEWFLVVTLLPLLHILIHKFISIICSSKRIRNMARVPHMTNPRNYEEK